MYDPFQQWFKLSDLDVARLPKYGQCPAVYAFRDAATRQILKFGNTGQLCSRMFGNYIGGLGGETAQRIHQELFVNGWIDRVELAWLETADKAEAGRKEIQFRARYKDAHGNLPLWERID